ncbi:MAG: outer membrane lipoprotein carrier protein LolA [Lysobacterales bacterium]|nr:MAG: outer membrane lipoprotein carrier protein LolA [Xanthomonadales bacterium]
MPSPVRLACAALALLLVAAVPGRAAADALERVEAYLGSLTTLSAEFSQVVRSREGDIVDRSSGTLSLSRPNRFRWDYREPYEQTIVGDGRRLWLYDPDLEQVTVRTLEAGLGSTPAMLLSGGGKVGDAFAAIGSERVGAWTWHRLRPRDADGDFESVSLAFDAKGELAGMELRDKLGQSTTLEFARLRRGAKLDDALFRFEPPPGADVIGRAEP